MFPCNSINLRLLQLLLPVTAVTVIRVIVRNIMMNIMINSIPPSHNPLRSRKGGKGRTWRKTSLRHRHQNPRPVPQAGCLASLPRLLKVLGVSTTVCLACLALPGLFDIRISFLTESFPSLSELFFFLIWCDLMEFNGISRVEKNRKLSNPRVLSFLIQDEYLCSYIFYHTKFLVMVFELGNPAQVRKACGSLPSNCSVGDSPMTIDD